MSKHTPGPWNAGRSDMATLVDGIPSKWIYAGNNSVAVASGRIDGDWNEVMANARLIAAAPELLEALESLLRFAERDRLPTDVAVNAARAAIAKAEGETQ